MQVAEFIMELGNHKALINLLDLTENQCEHSSTEKAALEEKAMLVLYCLSELDGYGKFLVDNCSQEIMSMLADNLLRFKE